MLDGDGFLEELVQGEPAGAGDKEPLRVRQHRRDRARVTAKRPRVGAVLADLAARRVNQHHVTLLRAEQQLVGRGPEVGGEVLRLGPTPEVDQRPQVALLEAVDLEDAVADHGHLGWVGGVERRRGDALLVRRMADPQMRRDFGFLPVPDGHARVGTHSRHHEMLTVRAEHHRPDIGLLGRRSCSRRRARPRRRGCRLVQASARRGTMGGARTAAASSGRGMAGTGTGGARRGPRHQRFALAQRRNIPDTDGGPGIPLGDGNVAVVRRDGERGRVLAGDEFLGLGLGVVDGDIGADGIEDVLLIEKNDAVVDG
ncbi:hypothetical protein CAUPRSCDRAFT_10741 [Caulochytrium protostelioides]|uniref:Uncharacterized protein n=1 Tax=Caulochytrium protostelioides TaxID=1555241 RepID=A0A4P9WZ58_9FUNG|nr:hypothetical protein CAUPRSCDRAFT_10741 [Caulochytrium protostelioides]